MEEEAEPKLLIYQDRAAVVSHIQALLTRLSITGGIFFFALCVVMSVIISSLYTDISRENTLITQSTIEILSLDREKSQLKDIIANQSHILENQKSNVKKLSSIFTEKMTNGK